MSAYGLATLSIDGLPRATLVVGDRAIDIAAATGLPGYADLLAIAQDWDAAQPRLEELAARADLPIDLRDATFLPPLLRPGAIYCAGANYADHAAEMAALKGQPAPPDPHDLGLRSWHFLKTMHCLTGAGAEVKLHPRAKKIDWEAELAVVIGRKGVNIKEADALDHVLGYTAANDLSARDLAARPGMPDGSSFKFDWVAHKNWDGSCPMGPWIAPANVLGDPQSLAIELTVNGEIKQRSNTSEMIFNIREQIADISRNVTLWPGDVILTGTPAGVGAGRGEFLKFGDLVSVRIEGLGLLETRLI